jgi:hypothetical protein
MAVAAVVVVVGACGGLAEPITVDGWEFPGAYPLPEGARSLPLTTEAVPESVPEGTAWGCDSAYLGPVQLRHDRDGGDAPLSFVTAEGGDEVDLVWQRGVSARLVGDRAEVVGPDGAVLAVEGRPSVELGGGGGAEGSDVFHVCFLEYLPRPAPTASPDGGGQPD